tara:strand:- start:1013 stop:1636 length:624 start_codon:yes stop_codon:yes gene_type:complete
MAITINGNGTITGVSVGGLPDGIVDTDMIAANAVTAAKSSGRKILQVVTTNVSATSSVAVQNGTIVDTPATVTVTSTAANSKFLISASINGEANTDDHNIGFVLRRVISGSTSSINVGTAEGNRLGISFMMNIGYQATDNSTTASSSVMTPYLDSPSQSASTAITYKIGVVGLGTTADFYFGRTVSDTNNNTNERTPNYITVMEIAA